jgi:hypothetical protein
VSRTINTAPLRVKLAQDPTLRRARHDHRLHDCNLPSLIELAQKDTYRYAACRYAATRQYRGLEYRCDCSWCGPGATPPRTLRGRGRDLLSRAAGRVPDMDLFDEIDDIAVPRR